jgi:hypothetical protein
MALNTSNSSADDGMVWDDFDSDAVDVNNLPDYFTDNNYGLLNVAKFALNEIKWNGSAVEGDAPPSDIKDSVDIVTAFPSSYSQFAIVVLSVIISAMMVVILVGNILVVIAIFTENNLTGVQNWFIASLAVADTMIGMLIMPFSLSSELMGYWMFGKMWCDVHAAMDVLLCTSSIMNICLISLDRFWSITRAIDYLHARTPVRVTIMIVSVWILSGLISIPPLLGWKVEQVALQQRWQKSFKSFPCPMQHPLLAAAQIRKRKQLFCDLKSLLPGSDVVPRSPGPKGKHDSHGVHRVHRPHDKHEPPKLHRYARACRVSPVHGKLRHINLKLPPTKNKQLPLYSVRQV